MDHEKSTIEKQKEQLARYEKRLRDVVTAYRGLCKEKEALEAIVKTVSEKGSKSNDAQTANEQKVLKTLSESLAVLTAEKSRMEANFQADKKKLRHEVEMLQNSVQDLAKSEKTLKYENEGLRTKLTDEKQDRLQEQETLHHMIRELQTQHESRVASLEGKLNELSISVGEYDRHRNADQQAILILKEQIMELESRSSKSVVEHELEKQDSPEKKDNFNSSNDDDIHGACREQHDMLLRELEHVKQLQSIQNMHDTRFQEANMEFDKLKSQNHNLHERIISLCKKLNQSENDFALHKQSLKLAVEHESEKCASEITTLKKQHEAQLSVLEDQIRLLRERSLSILEEKDSEINKLRNALKNISPTSVLAGELEQALNMESSGSPESGAKSSDNPLLFHFNQENARNMVEATLLRKKNFELEAQVRELTRKCATTSMNLEEKIEKLHQEIERLSLGQLREGANLEYLKNVVLSYLTCDDDKNKKHMLIAICAVLRFTKAESALVWNSKKGFKPV